MNIRKIILHSYNVHQGGGKRLLFDLLHPGNFAFFKQLNLDVRLPYKEKFPAEIVLNKVRPTILTRFLSEVKLFLSTQKEDVVLCFGSLPPLFPLAGRVIVFLHNKYNISADPHRFLKGRVKIQAWIERWWFRLGRKNVNLYVVQTPTMKRELRELVGEACEIRVLNLFHPSFFSKREKNLGKESSQFIYVASANPNKNHRALIQAWALLAAENIFPQLSVTIAESNFELIQYLGDICRKSGAKIINLGDIDYDQIIELYGRSDVLIYPSVLESLGLPLLEAKHYGLDILAPEMDYVRDLVHPAQTFDPRSATSMARAVKRYLGKDCALVTNLSGTQFLQEILKSPHS